VTSEQIGVGRVFATVVTACIAESEVVFLAGVFTTSEMALGLFVVALLSA